MHLLTNTPVQSRISGRVGAPRDPGSLLVNIVIGVHYRCWRPQLSAFRRAEGVDWGLFQLANPTPTPLI